MLKRSATVAKTTPPTEGQVVELRRRRGTESPEYSVVAPWFFAAVELYVADHDLFDDALFAALICCDVKSILHSADEKSQATLFLMLKYLYNHVPSAAWGSETAMGAWLRAKPKEESTDG
jgi:hypothetical protein